MKELKDYTSEELRAELKRRHKEALKNADRKTVYLRIKAVVEDAEHASAFVCNRYKLRIEDERVPSTYRHSWYRIKREKFRKDTVPNIGDTVILGHLLTKNRPNFTYSEAKIFEVVKRKNK